MDLTMRTAPWNWIHGPPIPLSSGASSTGTKIRRMEREALVWLTFSRPKQKRSKARLRNCVEATPKLSTLRGMIASTIFRFDQLGELLFSVDNKLQTVKARIDLAKESRRSTMMEEVASQGTIGCSHTQSKPKQLLPLLSGFVSKPMSLFGEATRLLYAQQLFI
ncbi:hypothetical protein L1049_004776 [Liquidambar formosana]|uniref:Uncharacterized protein n=1 Tax=Liquidambar formosana TaxID=63359 RepID=A0AAP0RTJ6_LIQFO